MINTRGTAILACALLAAVMTCPAALNADPIVSINAHLVDTLFVPAGGTYGLGVLKLEKTTAFTVVRTGGTTTTTDYFLLTTDLQSDVSAGGIMDGIFAGGSITLKTGDNATTLLTADIVTLELEEAYDNLGILAGSGLFVVTGGDYEEDFGDAGKLVQITFKVVPKVMDDFSDTFIGTTDLTMTPLTGDIPEPATLLLVGTGAVGALGYLRRRRVR